jgi:aspartate/methionine/tyrosine aminotransferase
MSTARDESAYLGATYPFAVLRERLSRHPRPYLDFALGRHVEPPPAWLPDFVREHAGLALRRCLRDEHADFTASAVRTLERAYGVSAPVDSVLPAPSGRAAMSALAATLLDPGDGVLVTEPGYPAFARVAAQRHARLHVVHLDPDRAFAPDVRGLDRSDAAGGIRIAALNYPNNPTGTVLSPATLSALRERLDPRALIFNDAVYGPLTHDGPPFSLLASEFAGNGGAKIVELHSLGKLFALGPLGVAFLVGPAEEVAQVRQYSDFAWTQISSLQVRTATRCLECWEHVERHGDALRDRLSQLRGVLSALGFETFPTPAGMYLLCRAPRRLGGRPVEGAAAAAELLLGEHDLAVAPWEDPPHSYLRFSACYLPEELEALAELGPGFAG